MVSQSFRVPSGRALRLAVAALVFALTTLGTLGAPRTVWAEDAALPTAESLLAAMDKNLQFDTRTSTASMTVDDGRHPRTYKMVSFGRGTTEAAMEYLLPERDKGTKMLKLGDQLWLYLPRSERVQKISGHMLRQGMMGSDVSYEDLMSAESFATQYVATVVGSETLEGRTCWRIEANARDESVTYPKRVMWIDAQSLMPLRQELFAVSGMKLKTWTMSDIRTVEGRQVAFRMEIADELKPGSKTVLVTESVSFGVPLEDEVFTKNWLERR